MQFPLEILKRCWFLAGPTACSKSETGVEIAKTIDAEIVSLDSMSLYRGMDIGTAKPSPGLRNSVPHHLVDIINPDVEFSVAQYIEAAERVCREILSRDRVPLFVGGTGLYLRTVLRGVFEAPAADWKFRRQLQKEETREGANHLHKRLFEVDPQSAESLHPHDTRRVIRALEVYHLTGKPISSQQRQPPLAVEKRPQHVYWLSPPRDWLYQRVNKRVETMRKAGLVDEVKRLLESERPLSRTARQGLGYKEIIEYLEGQTTLDAAIDRLKTRTRQFAKRQHTWFRNLEECQMIEMAGDESPAELAASILSVANRSS